MTGPCEHKEWIDNDALELDMMYQQIVTMLLWTQDGIRMIPCDDMAVQCHEVFTHDPELTSHFPFHFHFAVRTAP